MKFAIGLICIILAAGCSSNGNKTDTPVDVPIRTTNNTEQLFKNTCAQCHKCDVDFTGPSLRGVWDRWPDKKLLFEFVRNSQEVIAKDVYAKELFKKYNQTYMNPYPQLTDEDIKSLLLYCNFEDPSPAVK